MGVFRFLVASNSKGGEKENMEIVEQVLEVLKNCDRLPSNPDDGFLRKTIEKLVTQEGVVRFFVFVCQKSKYTALSGPRPEEYMPVTAERDDLLQPRVPKILELQEKLRQLGVPMELCFLIGDADFEIFKLPYLEGITIDREVFARRMVRYADSFEARVKKDFGRRCTVFSLSTLGIGPDKRQPSLPSEDLASELEFIRSRYREGRYGDPLNFPEKVICEMTDLKLRCYGNQGHLLKDLGPGVLLQTEGGPGRWLLRTTMLRCTGSRAVPAIYPWIRSEELEEMELN